MCKQYGRQEVAFNLKDPERRGRPDPFTHATTNSGSVTYLKEEFCAKARSTDPRNRPTPILTYQSGPDAGYTMAGNGSVPQPATYMGRQNGNQGNAEYRMGAKSFVPATVISNNLGVTQTNLKTASSGHMGNTNLTGNPRNKFIPRHNPITGERSQH